MRNLPITPRTLTQESVAANAEPLRPAMRREAMRHAGDAMADDIVQLAVITAISNRACYTVGTDFRAWLLAITRNVARNTRRAESRRRYHETRYGCSVRRRSRPAAWLRTLAAEGVEAVEGELLTLPERQRVALVLRCAYDAPYKAIANALGIAEVSARSLVTRGRNTFRTMQCPPCPSTESAGSGCGRPPHTRGGVDGPEKRPSNNWILECNTAR